MAYKNCVWCEDTFEIGCFLHCDLISTGLLSTQAGVHNVSLKFLNSVQVIEVTIALIGDEFTIPLGTLNETSDTVISIENPDGTTFSMTTGSVTYECFKTKLLINV